MGTITQRALSLIDRDDYMTPEESLAYLEQPSNRSSISRQLIRTIRALGVDGDETELIAYLLERLSPLCGVTKPEERKKLRQMISGWFRRNTPMKREMAFKCCFALGLDIGQSEELLRKGCYLGGFNLRSAEEVVYFFCLLHGYPYEKAQEMLCSYRDAPYRDDPDNIHGTRTILREVQRADWESERAFLEDFLIPNKQNFTGYSKTAAAVFEREIGKLCYNVIRQHLRMLFQTDVVSDDISASHESYWTKDPILSSVRRYIDGMARSDEAFARISGLIGSRRSSDARDTVDQVDWFVLDNKKVFERDWEKIFSADRIFSEAVYGIPEVWYLTKKINRESSGSFTPYKERLGFKKSRLFGDNNVLSAFPRASDLAGVKRDQAGSLFAPEGRKIIILLRFLNYCYDFMRTNSPDLSYELFYDELTDTLDACRMAYLYPGDPFDWLILKAVRLFELSSDVYDYEEDENPIEYLNAVLELSFPEEDTIEVLPVSGTGQE